MGHFDINAEKVEGMHAGFLRQIMGKRAQQVGDRTWDTPG